MKSALAISLLWASAARAQASGSELSLAIILGPPSLANVGFDIVLARELAAEGTAPRGGAITAMVFSALGAIASAICLSVGLETTNASPLWKGLSAASLGFDLASMALAVYAIAHPAVEAERESAPPLPPRPILPPQPQPIPPQL
jgi:hypothetical protein